MSDEELMPCPFCGGEAFIDDWENRFGCMEGSIACDCGVTGADIDGDNYATWGEARRTAIKAWNTRATDANAVIRDLPKDGSKFVKQLNRHKPEKGIWGDCYRTCIANLIGVPPSEVPHVYDKGKTDGVESMRAFLTKFGLSVFYMGMGAKDFNDLLRALNEYNPDQYFIITGSSKNKCNHTVICKNGKIAHDPSQDNSGIIGPCDQGYYWIDLLIPLTRHAKVIENAKEIE